MSQEIDDDSKRQAREAMQPTDDTRQKAAINPAMEYFDENSDKSKPDLTPAAERETASLGDILRDAGVEPPQPRQDIEPDLEPDIDR